MSTAQIVCLVLSYAITVLFVIQIGTEKDLNTAGLILMIAFIACICGAYL